MIRRNFYYGENLIVECFKEIIDSKAIGIEATDKIIAYLNRIQKNTNSATFIFSLTEEDEEFLEDGYLPSWRWYGDDGKGVRLKVCTSGRYLLGFPRKIIYIAETFKLIAKEIILRSLESNTLDECIAYLVSLVKDKNYKEENEWRYVVCDETNIKIHEDKKYHVLRLDPHPHKIEELGFGIKEILIGPADKKNKQDIEKLNKLISTFPDEGRIEVRTSGIKYNCQSSLREKCKNESKRLLEHLEKSYNLS